MYERHFALSGRPFDLTPNPDFLYLGKKHALALALLEYSVVSQATVAVVTGEIGSGKTTLLYHLLNKMPAGASVTLVSQTPRSLTDLISWVMADLGVPLDTTSEATAQREFLKFIELLAEEGGRLILLIDEAQSLALETLESIRMLTNANHHGHVALQLVLVGQPELLDNLRQPRLKQLAQRVSIDFHLGGLDEKETIRYIGHRLAVVGGDESIIPEDTRRTVYHASGGIPRLINVLCDTGMVYAFADGRHIVGNDLMQAVVMDRRAGGIIPLSAPAHNDDNVSPISGKETPGVGLFGQRN